MKQAELNKLLSDTLRQSAKEHNWKYSRGFVFKTTDLLFFCVIVVAQAKRHDLSYSLGYKFLTFDDLFWKIVRLEENLKQPLSFRASGAWTAPMATISDGTLSVTDWNVTNVRLRVDQIIVRCESDTTDVTKQISDLDDNLRLLEELYARLKTRYPDAVTNIWVERLLTSILKNEYAQADAIIRDRLAAHDSGGFQVGAKSFYDLAREHIRALS